MTHTPGPWEVVKSSRGLYQIFPIAKPEPPAIQGAIAVIDARDDLSIHYRDVTALANAYVQAAAPDLLEVLEECFSLLNPMIKNPASEILMGKITSAINKAKGL